MPHRFVKNFLIFLLSLVFYTKHCLSAGEPSCGYIRGPDGYYYRFVNQWLPWKKAKAVCESEDAQLAIYLSSDTFRHIKNSYAIHHYQIWMGASYTDSLNRWRWLDQSLVETKYWELGHQPTFAGQNSCGMIRHHHLLVSEHCEQLHPFICQKTKDKCSSKTAASSCGSLSEEAVCKPYHCYQNMAQYGFDLSFRRTDSLDECAKYCCQVPSSSCNCVGFDWTRTTKQCSLSYISRSAVPLMHAQDVYSCELRKIPRGFVRGYKDSYFKIYTQQVSWDVAYNSCLNDKAQLVEFDSSEKWEYLTKRLGWKRFWTGKKCAVLDTLVDPKPREKSCTTIYPFVCEIPMKTVQQAYEEKNERFYFPWWVIGVICGLISVVVRVLLYMRFKKRRQAMQQRQNQIVVAPTSLPGSSQAQPAGSYSVQQYASSAPPAYNPPPYDATMTMQNFPPK